jgi:hypothetical protein
MDFTVSLSSPSNQPVTVHYTTVGNGTATPGWSIGPGIDYLNHVGTLTFAPGQVTQTIPVTVVGNPAGRPDVNFTLALSNPTNATIARGVAVGTIVNGDGIVKFQVAANGSVYALQGDGKLLVDGRLKWINKADFAFDPQNRVILWDTAAAGGALGRSTLPFAGGVWEPMGRGVVKFQVAANGSVWALQGDGGLYVNGKLGWINKADFAFDPQNRVILRDTAAAGGALDRSTLPFAGGVWEPMGRGVVKFQVSPSGDVYALQFDGSLDVNGRQVWAYTRDFELTPDGRYLYWLGTAARDKVLQRFDHANPGAGWQNLERGVRSFVLYGGNYYTFNEDNRFYCNGVVLGNVVRSGNHAKVYFAAAGVPGGSSPIPSIEEFAAELGGELLAKYVTVQTAWEIAFKGDPAGQVDPSCVTPDEVVCKLSNGEDYYVHPDETFKQEPDYSKYQELWNDFVNTLAPDPTPDPSDNPSMNPGGGGGMNSDGYSHDGPGEGPSLGWGPRIGKA